MTENSTKVNKKYISEIVEPKQNEIFTCGDSIEVKLTIKNSNVNIDSIELFAGNKPVQIFSADYKKIFWNSLKAKVGLNTIKTTVYYNDSLKESHSVSLTLLSNVTPKQYTYRIINTFPHDKDAYLQGLVYENGLLYESTGIRGKSSIRKINIESGKPLIKIDLDPQIFGEGIAIFKNNIYQITYKSQTGFIYDKENLTQIRKFDYQLAEGWGLTNDQKNLFMTDGSSSIYIIEPEYFSQVGRLNVFDNKGRIDNLNELEYINGKIFANVYGETIVVIIDPETGKVTGVLDLQKLMPEGFEGDLDHVANGIAYNPDNNHLFVSGKLWPVLYEIEIEGYF